MNSHRSCEQFGPGWQTAAYMRTTRGGVWQEASAFDETVELLQQQPLVHDTSLSTLESTSTVNELHDDEGPKRKKPRYDGSNPEKDAQEILKLLNLQKTMRPAATNQERIKQVNQVKRAVMLKVALKAILEEEQSYGKTYENAIKRGRERLEEDKRPPREHAESVEDEESAEELLSGDFEDSDLEDILDI